MSTPKAELYFLDNLHNFPKEDVYITKGQQGAVHMVISANEYKIPDLKGWKTIALNETPTTIKLDQENNSITLHFKNNIPLQIHIPENIERENQTISENEAKMIVKQMKEKGKMYSDFWTEYFDGTSVSFIYDNNKNTFVCTKCDIIAASFIFEEIYTEKEMIAYFMEKETKGEMRSQGFYFE